jgi:hypothetical protein
MYIQTCIGSFYRVSITKVGIIQPNPAGQDDDWGPGKAWVVQGVDYDYKTMRALGSVWGAFVGWERWYV